MTEETSQLLISLLNGGRPGNKEFMLVTAEVKHQHSISPYWASTAPFNPLLNQLVRTFLRSELLAIHVGGGGQENGVGGEDGGRGCAADGESVGAVDGERDSASDGASDCAKDGLLDGLDDGPADGPMLNDGT